MPCGMRSILAGCLVNLLQHLSPPLRHDHEQGRERDQLLHYAPLVGFRLTQNGMKRSNNGHYQFAQECQDMAAGRPSENTEFVLQADDVHVADVEEVRST